MPAGAADEFLDHNVWIEHRGGRWIAGVDKDRECIIACIWNEDSGDANALCEIISITGKYAAYVNQSLTNSEKTERIWSFLECESILMKPRLMKPLRIVGVASFCLSSPLAWCFKVIDTFRRGTKRRL